MSVLQRDAESIWARLEDGPLRYFELWKSHWLLNKRKIIILTLINLILTLSSEILTREFLSLVWSSSDIGFFSGPTLSWQSINEQSLISLFMTIFATLIGAPVYFFSTKRSRLIFFLSFGLVNSVLAQSILSGMKIGTVVISFRRLIFDFLYTLTFKFVIFEFFRGPVVKHNRFSKLFFYRVNQDVFSSLVKNSALVMIGLKGNIFN